MAIPGSIPPARATVSQPPEPTPPTFSHDLTLKSVFAEPDTAADLIAFLVQYRCPELRGWMPVQVVAGSSVTTDPETPPHQSEGHRDLVWLLEQGDRPAERMLLHLEFQSQRDRDMSGRMFGYALETTPSLRDLEICGLVVNTGLRPLDPWRVPVQSVAGSYRYGFREGLLLDIHAFRVPGLPGGDHPLPVDNLVSSVMALARLQAEMKLGRRAAAALVLPVLRALIPLALASTPTLRRGLGAWFKTGFGELMDDQPVLRGRWVESPTLRRRRRSCTHSDNTWRTRRRRVRRGSSSSSSGRCGAMRRRTGVPGNWRRPNSATCPTSQT